jgi:hypothetical protein
MKSVIVFIFINISCDLIMFGINLKNKKRYTIDLKKLFLSNILFLIPLVMARELDLIIENNSFLKITQLVLIGFIGKEIIRKLDYFGIPISEKIREIFNKIDTSS